MVTQHGIKFAVHLITNHFGNLVAKVCENLLRRGPLTLQLLIRYTELTSQQVKNSLLILIQHNCIQPFSIELEGHLEDGPKANTQYMALFDNILHRMRFSKFSDILSQELDNECRGLLEGLLQHGRLTTKQMVERAQSGQKEGNREDVVQESLRKLLTAHFVEHCPSPQPVLASVKEGSTTKKRGAKSAKTNEVSKTLEQRVLEAAAPMEAKRFSFISITESDVNRNTSGNNSPSMSVGEKRKQDALELDRESTAEREELVLWRANFEEFMRRLRHKACIENVRARLDDGAAIVLGAMLEATRSSEKKVKTEKSVPLSMNTIFEEVMKSEAGRGMTLDRVRASLIQLGCSHSTRGTDESYSIDLKKVIEYAQNDEVESIVLKRYGRDAYRMFRLLSKSGSPLETDKISDTTFVEKKDAPKILYKLWKDEYLHMEKLVLTGPRQFPFLVWKVNKPSLYEHVLDEMYHAALNLCQRVAYEREKEKEYINLPADKQVVSLEERYNRLRNVRILLETSLLKLDDALMLFHDF